MDMDPGPQPRNEVGSVSKQQGTLPERFLGGWGLDCPLDVSPGLQTKEISMHSVGFGGHSASAKWAHTAHCWNPNRRDLG